MTWLLVLAFLASLSAGAPVAAQGVGGPGGNPNNPIAPNQPCPDDSNRIANTHFVHECAGGGGGGGSIPLGLGFTITPGQDNPAAGALATPLTIGTNTLYGQIDPLPFFVDTPITAAMMGHNVKAMAGVSIALTLGQAGTPGFEKGTSICFVAQGSGGLTLTAAGGSLLHGVPVASNIMTSAQYGNGCAASDGTDWDVSWSFPSGTGSVTSISAGSHITNTPDPIIATGTVSFSQMATNTVVANPTSGTANAQDLAVPSCSGFNKALQWTTNTGFNCPTDVANFDYHQIWTSLSNGANQSMPSVILTDGATISTDGILSNYYKVTLTGNNHTLDTPTNLRAGNYTWFIYTGAGFTGFATSSGFKWIGGTPVWSTAAGKEDVISCLVDDTLVMACFAGIDAGGTGGGLSLTNAHIYVGNSSNIATDVAVSGVVTLANTGVFSFASSTGSGAVVLATAPSVSSLTVTSAFTATGLVTAADLFGTTGSGGNVVLATSPSISGLTVTSSFTATGLVTLADIATEAANTVVANITSGAASPTAAALPSCTDTGGNHLNYTNGTGFSCGTSGGGAANLTVGSSTISGGTTARLLYDNSAVLGETAVTYNGTTLTGLPTPSGSTDAASKSYVDNIAAAINPAVAVKAATTQASDTSGLTYTHVAGIGDFFTGSVNTAITFDGVTLTAVNQRVLIKNDTQSPSGAFNGVYYLSQLQTGILAPILIRALDYDQPSDINNTGAIPVVSGTVNANTSWLLTSSVTTVGTDPLTYTQFSIAPSDIMTLSTAQTATGQKDFARGKFVLDGTTGTLVVQAAATASTNTLTLPAGTTDLSATGGTSQVLKQVSSGAAITVARLACADLSDAGAGCTGAAGSGVVNSGTAGQMAYYASTAATVSGNANVTISNGALTLGVTSGPVAGSVTMWGSTSGSLQLKPAAAAGTSSVITFPSGITDFSATGAANAFVKQNSSGAALTVATIACADLSNGATGCSTATGTSGGTIPLLNGTNTWSGVQTFGNGQITPNNAVVATLLATGTSVSLTGPREYYVCTGTCTVTPPVPVAGYEFCVMNDDNVATAITLAALGSSAKYENTARTAYGTAGTGTLSATAVVGNKVCILGLDSTHYLTTTFTGSWTAS